MKNINDKSETATSDHSELVIKYFGSNKHFVQIPNRLYLDCRNGNTLDLFIYSLLYQGCFSRHKGNFQTKFNISTIAEIADVSYDEARKSLNSLLKNKHIKNIETVKKDDDITITIDLLTRCQGRDKYLKGVKVA